MSQFESILCYDFFVRLLDAHTPLYKIRMQQLHGMLRICLSLWAICAFLIHDTIP